jgi:hypothetical protein
MWSQIGGCWKMMPPSPQPWRTQEKYGRNEWLADDVNLLHKYAVCK